MLHLECTIKLPSIQELQNMSLEDIIAEQRQISSQFTKESFCKIMSKLQATILEYHLGKRWNGSAHGDDKPWCCARCCQRKYFHRRGSKERKITCSLGQLNFELYQLGCKQCGHRFSPFPQMLNMKPRQKFADEFKEKLISLATNLSYDKTSKAAHKFLSVSAHGKTIHSWIQQTAQATALPPHQASKAILLDGTGVPATKQRNTQENQKNNNCKLVIGLGRRVYEHGRPKQLKKVLGLTVGKSWPQTVKQAQAVKTSMLITDGENSFDKISQQYFLNVPKQRCLWHLPRTLGAYLTRFSDLGQEARKPWLEQLKNILFGKGEKSSLQTQYTLLVKKLRHAGHLAEASMLAGATKEVFVYKVIKKKGHKGIATSIIERQMREVNRRADVGVRWSNQGLENMLKLNLLQREEPQYWSEIVWNTIPNPQNPPKLLFQMSP
jgi:hypothetical protein